MCDLNTHQGLYRPTRLQFHIHSASRIFQRNMDQKLGHNPEVNVRVDDILLFNKDDKGHIQTLKEVLKIIHKIGMKLKKSKCIFFVDKVANLASR